VQLIAESKVQLSVNLVLFFWFNRQIARYPPHKPIEYTLKIHLKSLNDKIETAS
jgi:hypothetical protein